MATNGPTMQERLHEEMKTAMKAGNKDRLGVIRMLLSDVKNVDLNPQKPTPEQAVEQYGKKLKKSVEEYEKIGRTEEVVKLRAELAFLTFVGDVEDPLQGRIGHTRVPTDNECG